MVGITKRFFGAQDPADLSKERRQEHQQLQSDTCAAWLVPTQCQCNDPIPKRWMRRHWLRLRFWVPNAELVDLRWMEFFFFLKERWMELLS